MNRSDLHWMLNAVIPHAGKRDGLATVGIALDGVRMSVYATDGYTAAHACRFDDSPPGGVSLSVSEARELLRFVRPTLKATELEPVRLLARDGELHVGLEDDSAVFETCASDVTFRHVNATIRSIVALPVEWQQLVYQPSLMAKLAKAQRDETDRLRIYPRRATNRNGVAFITVGDHFQCAVAGLTYDDRADGPLLPDLKGSAA